MKISKIFIYDEPAVPQINIDGLSQFLENTFRVKTVKRRNIFESITEGIASDIASSRVLNPRATFEPHAPTRDEIEFEMRKVSKGDGIVMYDGFELQKTITGLIPPEEAVSDNIHLVVTDKLTCTFDDTDYRYHGRAVIGSNPSIISTTGIIEAPAKPRQYYMDLMANYSQGLNVDLLKDRYRGSYLEYNDERLGTVIEGYCMQAIFYYITGDPFCEFLDCRLNNAHWQRDLLYSQLEHGSLCAAHQRILSKWLALNDLNYSSS